MQFLDNKFFLQVIVPLITVFLTIFLKVVSRNDRMRKFKREDLAFGLEISATALIIFVLGGANLSKLIVDHSSPVIDIDGQKLVSLTIVLFAIFMGTWSVSTLIRWYGWERGEPHLIWGIAVPNLFGLFVLLLAFNFIGRYL